MITVDCIGGGTPVGSGIGAQEDEEGSVRQEVERGDRDFHRRIAISSATGVNCSTTSRSLLPIFATIFLTIIQTGGGLAYPWQPMIQSRGGPTSQLHYLVPFTFRNPFDLKMTMFDDENNLLSTTNPLQSSLPHSLINSKQPDDKQRDDTILLSKQQQLLPQAQTIQFETLSRILLPSFLSSLLAYTLFPSLALGLSYLINDSATFAVLSVDSSQFIQNFLTVTGLTFSILVGQTYYFMYQQQEAVFVSLFWEVTEAKSLLEQVALVSQGRKDMYEMCLVAVKRYVEEDLKKGLGKEPAKVLSARPMDDPLEIIMYMTSVGVPSSIYDTVRSLRQARARRLGALQKKLPSVHLLLLWLLAVIELSSFPVLGAGTQTIGGYNILTIEGVLFGIMTFGIVLTLNIVGELYVGSGGAYNVDSVLRVMVNGLDEELDARMNDIDVDIRSRAFLSVGERTEVEKRQGMVLPSPVYYPMRFSTTYVGEDSVEANSI